MTLKPARGNYRSGETARVTRFRIAYMIRNMAKRKREPEVWEAQVQITDVQICVGPQVVVSG